MEKIKPSDHIGIEIYHMMQKYGANYKIYEERLVELSKNLGQLANFSQVIWLNQYPTVEFYGGMQNTNIDIHTEKIYHYNKMVKRIFK